MRSASLRYLFSPLLFAVLLSSCSAPHANAPSHLVFVIESNPANLDPRYSSDAQSQRIDRLIFDGLVERDAQMNLHGDLAESWGTPDPLTYIFHLRRDVKFHDARPVTSHDVQSTFAFMMNPANKSPKAGAFKMIRSIETPDDHTVIFHLNEPAASFLWNLERSAVGIVPADATADFNRKLIGSGPSASSASRKTTPSSSNKIQTISAALPNFNPSPSASSPTPSSAPSNSAKAPPTSKSVPSLPT